MIQISNLLSEKITRPIARPRQVAMALAKEPTNHSLLKISETFGRRDHTTVLYVCNELLN